MKNFIRCLIKGHEKYLPGCEEWPGTQYEFDLIKLDEFDSVIRANVCRHCYKIYAEVEMKNDI